MLAGFVGSEGSGTSHNGFSENFLGGRDGLCDSHLESLGFWALMLNSPSCGAIPRLDSAVPLQRVDIKLHLRRAFPASPHHITCLKFLHVRREDRQKVEDERALQRKD